MLRMCLVVARNVKGELCYSIVIVIDGFLKLELHTGESGETGGRSVPLLLDERMVLE